MFWSYLSLLRWSRYGVLKVFVCLFQFRFSEASIFPSFVVRQFVKVNAVQDDLRNNPNILQKSTVATSGARESGELVETRDDRISNKRIGARDEYT